jgi:hypothetical protein
MREHIRMKPHPRIRKTIKWTGAAATLLLVVARIESRPSHISWGPRLGPSVMIHRGVVDLTYLSRSSHELERDLYDILDQLYQSGDFAWVTLHGSAAIRFPLWIPALCIALATIAAWRLDWIARRVARFNLCPKCHYDRAGLAKDAKCPECGANV